MKKYLFLLFLGVFFISSASAVISRNLSVGSTGSDVLELQSELGVKPTGYYGNLTKQAVKAWQLKNDLPNSGYFGVLSKKIWNFGTSIDPERLPPIPEDFCTYVKGTVIRVLSPNGGETYQAGQQITVKWKTCNIPAGTNVSIQLLRQNVDSQYNSPSYYGQAVVVQTVSNSGSYSWTIPNSVPDGTNYLIDINGSLTGQEGSGFLDRSDNTFSINSKISTTLDSTPRVAMWYGKVNQHIDEKGNWITDPDGVSGAGTYSQWGSEGYGDRKLEYCKKFYPKTTSVEDYKNENITTWREKYNTGGPYTASFMTTRCVEGSDQKSITLISPKSGETLTAGQRVSVTWSTNANPSTLVYLVILDSNNNLVREFRTPNDGQETISIPASTTPGQYKIYYHVVNSIYGNGNQAKDFATINIISPIISNSYTISFDMNWSGATQAPIPLFASVGQSVTLPAAPLETNPGYVFSGWSTAPSPTTQGPSNTYQAGSLYTLTLAQNIPMFAVWKKNNTVLIDPTPRIAYWWGKVNQHTDEKGNWVSDPDGVSGADLDKLTYCRKWYSNTVSVEPYKEETINTWKRAISYEQSGYTATMMSYKCVQQTVGPTPSITVVSPNGGEVYQAGGRMEIKWKNYNTPTGSLARILLARNMPNNFQEQTVILDIKNNYNLDRGSYIWNIPNSQNPGTNYFLSVVCGNSNGGNCVTGSGNIVYAITDDSDGNFTINAPTNTVLDSTPRIAYWWGKVNQHFEQIDMGGEWMTDGDGVSGANLDKLTYCKKFYPNTISIQDYKNETITGWRNAGNTGGPYTLEVMTTKCVFR